MGDDCASGKLAFLWTGNNTVDRVVVVFLFWLDAQSLSLIEFAAIVQMIALISVIIKIRDPSILIFFLQPIVLIGVSLDSDCLIEFYHLRVFLLLRGLLPVLLILLLAVE